MREKLSAAAEEDVHASGTGTVIFFFCPVLHLSFCDFQMTEQRKQKQRIGLLGHPQHMNVNPQQPA